jgi:hypothetical protein
MITDSQARTLYDDWKARRERLADAPGAATGYQAIEMRILDFLLWRYQASAEAARPARFPLLTGAFVNHRVLVVHRHLRRGPASAVTNEQEARAYVQAMLGRIWSPSARDERAVSDAGVARRDVPPPDPVEEARIKLCDRDPVVRIQAAVELGEIGGLDDIGLLSDLLSLPTSPDEHPREREALVHAMRRLSGESTERFDPGDVLSVTDDPTSLGPRAAGTKRSDERRAAHYFHLFLIVLAATLLILGAIYFRDRLLDLFRTLL